MTRKQAKENLISIGIEEPTEEQITNYLNQVNGESKKEKDKAEQYKADAEKAEELQRQLDELNNQNLSDIEKANKERDDALNSIATLQNQIKTMELKTKFAEKGIVGEQADKLLESLNGGSFDVDILGQIISDRETMAAQAKEKEIADKSTNPGGGSAGGKEDNRTNAEKIASNLFSNKSEKADIISHYTNGGR